MAEASKRKLAAILMADAVGYSRLMEQDEAATVAAIKVSRKIFRTHVEKCSGRIVNAPGDSILADFASVVDALSAAVEIQRDLSERNHDVPEDQAMQFRVGINLGDVLESGEELYGDGVNIAARLESLAEPGGICISGTAYDQVKGKLPLAFEDIGSQSVKNIRESVRTYRILSKPGGASHRVVKARRTAFTRGKLIGLAVSAVLVGAIVTAGFVFTGPQVQQVTPYGEEDWLPVPEIPSIAVLPFKNMSGDSEQDYFADGFTETLITELSKLPGMFVIARLSAFQFKNQQADIRDVASKLGVRYVMEGSIQKAGSRVRVNAQLIDGTDGTHLWAQVYDRNMSDFFSVQDDLIRKIVVETDVNLVSGEDARFWRTGTTNVAAYENYLLGHYHYWRFAEDDNLIARQYLKKAVELDRDFGPAYSLWAMTYYNTVQSGWSDDIPGDLARFSDLSEKGLTLAPDNANAHMSRALYLFLSGQHDEALSEISRATELNPNGSLARVIKANILVHAGRPEEALKPLRQAMRLSPVFHDCYYVVLGDAYRLMGKYDKAIEAFEVFLDRSPGYIPCHIRLIATYDAAGDNAKAHEAAQRLLERRPDFSVDEFATVWGRYAMPYKDPATFQGMVDALRRAGLK